MTCPHFGWGTETTTWRMLHGEQYARLLNASWFVPTCGTITNDIVRKHFEIPASKACLIAERSPATAAAGFVEWQNCIFADDVDIIDKLDYLFNHREELERITAAGYNLVHRKHTIKQRDQILQWFTLRKQLTPQQHIIQCGPFGPLTVADRRMGLTSSHTIGNGLDRVLLSDGDRELWAGKYRDAERLYLKALNYLPLLPEAKLRLAICNLYVGNASVALGWIDELLTSSERLCAIEPDPVEWAYFLIALVCQGKLGEAAKHAAQYRDVHHPELDRVRQLIDAIERSRISYKSDIAFSGRRCSVHQLPSRSLEQWMDCISTMLKACKQFRLVEQISNHSNLESNRGRSDDRACAPVIDCARITICRDELSTRGRRSSLNGRLGKLLVVGRTARWIRRYVKDVLHGRERAWGYFLPYRVSAMRNDELFGCVESVAREANIRTILVFGAACTEGITEACLAGGRANPNQPAVICVNNSRTQLMKLQKRDPGSLFIRCCNEVSEATKQARDIGASGMVVITGVDEAAMPSYDEVERARLIVLNDINSSCKFSIVRRLDEDNSYTLLAHNPNHRGGYAIFRRR